LKEGENRLKNNESSRKSREKKKAYVAGLEKDVARLKEETKILRAENGRVKSLEKENKVLRIENERFKEVEENNKEVKEEIKNLKSTIQFYKNHTGNLKKLIDWNCEISKDISEAAHYPYKIMKISHEAKYNGRIHQPGLDSGSLEQQDGILNFVISIEDEREEVFEEENIMKH